MKKDVLTKYMAIFLVGCIIIDVLLIVFFSHAAWWNNWMAMPAIIYMICGAFFSHLMKKNVDNGGGKLVWLYFYKGTKLFITILCIVLFYFFVKGDMKAFLTIILGCYIASLTGETWTFTDYLKYSKNKKSSQS
jgi:hypothetical protein